MARTILLLAANEREYIAWCVAHHFEAHKTDGDTVLWVKKNGPHLVNLHGHDIDTTVWYVTGRWYLYRGAHILHEELTRMYGPPTRDEEENG